MKKAIVSRLCLVALLLSLSIVTAKEKLLVVVQKTNLLDITAAQNLMLKTGNLLASSEKYSVIDAEEMNKIHQKEFGKTNEATDNDLSKIGSRSKADAVLAVMLQNKSDNTITATARLVDVKSENLLSFNKIDYSFGLDEFGDKGLAGLVDPLFAGKNDKIPQGTLVVKTNDPIKVFVDKKRVKDTFLSNLRLAEGYHEVFLQREDGYIIDKKNVYFAGDSQIEYNYVYSSKGNAVAKSLMLPGLGHFSTGRNVAGSVYATAAVGGLGILGFGIMSYNQSKSDYDDAKSSYDAAVKYADRVNYAEKVNGFRDDCSSANTLVMAGAAVLGVAYVASFLDIYLTGTEHKLDVKGNENPFGSRFELKGNTLSYSFGQRENSEKYRDKQ